MNNTKLRKQLRRQMKELRKAYAHALRDATINRTGEWLSDNYYILAREGASVGKALRYAEGLPQGADGIAKLFWNCVQACEAGILPDTAHLIASFQKQELCASEVQALELMLRCALLYRAWEAVCVQKGTGQETALGAAIKSLRNIQEVDFETVVEQVSALEQLLLQDPAGIYAQMDRQTRSIYRRQVERSARKKNCKETDLARGLLQKAKAAQDEGGRHIGAHLWAQGKRSRRGWIFLAIEMGLPAVLSVALGALTGYWYVPLLIVLPLWDTLRPLIERLSLRKVPPDYLPRLKPESDAALQYKTLITVSMLLPGPKDVQQLQKRMLELWRSNGRSNIKICCLLDLKGAGTPEKPEDRAAIAAARRAVEALNRKYDDAFVLAIRPRIYSPTQGTYTGKERKRGAITELVRAIHGDESGFLVLDGDRTFLQATDFLLALDADTMLPMDTAATLAAIGVHPLNRPVVDAERGAVVAGYGIIAPRMETDLPGDGVTSFTRWMAGDGGLTIYDSFASERYQDLFGEGIFAGKGLIDVHVFHQLLDDVFPQEQVLSHDILESGYLRTGFASDVQAADGFPKRHRSYFARLNRWVRGDWQNIRYIFSDNPLNGLSRYKLLDNLRRSLTPILAWFCALLSVFLPPMARGVVFACAVLSVAGPGLLAFFRCLVKGGPNMLSRIYYSGVMPEAMSILVRTVLSLVMLPQTAVTCLDAMLRALWRLLVSKRKLLEWTTAAQSEQAGSAIGTFRQCLPALLSGALLLLGGQFHRLLAIIFFADTLVILFSGKERKHGGISLDYQSQERLQSYAAAMWRYYEEQCTAENHYLPPDNFQETPVYTVAHRTSPTNIGLAMLCCLAARDLGFISTVEMKNRIEQCMDTIDKLEKWNGNLLNWYDTRTLAPLKPKYVSTVDSGNFLCCLVTLRQGLSEYLAEDATLFVLMQRLDALREGCDLTPLYNARRKLFHIGIDLSSGELSPSYYDLLMSEARMTGYYAIASRTVSKKHWGAMGRMLVRDGRYTGPVSWTGTMFEYFMPALFLPAPKGSLSYEGLKFCLWCQKKRTREKNVPWGISESGFFAFDRQLNYQYKAHGVQKLGLKRGLNQELVVAPYASFLAMPLAPEDALRNLERLEKMEMMGRCGFYEAADFTASRTGGQDYAVVRSYMAHHVGMSLLSVLNTLKDNTLQKRFLFDDTMAAASSLLLEKIPAGTTVFKDVEMQDIPKTRERVESSSRVFSKPSAAAPHVKLLTNGEWTTVLSDVGAGVSIYRGSHVTQHSRDLLRRPAGVFALLRYHGKVLPAVSVLGDGDAAKFQAEFSDNAVTHTAENASVRIRTQTSVHPRLPCEQRQYQIKNLSGREISANLLLYLEPSLTTEQVSQEHPAFSKLFLLDEYDRQNRLLLFTRRPRESGHALCLAVGFSEETQGFSYTTARNAVLHGVEGTKALLDCPGDFTAARGNPDACAAFDVPIKLPAKGSKTLTMLFACAATKEEAVTRMVRAREQGMTLPGKGALCPFAKGGLAAVLSEAVLPSLFFCTQQTKEAVQAIGQNTMRGRAALWSFGISGDLPILYVEIRDAEDVARALPYFILQKQLNACSISTDVVLAYHEGGEYDSPVSGAIRQLLKQEGCEEHLGVGGGIHTINFDQRDEREEIALRAAAAFIAPDTAERFDRNDRPYHPLSIRAGSPVQTTPQVRDPVKYGYFTDGNFVIEKLDDAPGVPWSFVYSNPTFGTMVSHQALGYTWAINSRENKLTPWYNDVCTDNRGEMLLLQIGGDVYDLLLGARVSFSPKQAVWEGVAAGIQYTVTIHVPRRGMVKQCRVTLKNVTAQQDEAWISYYTEPVMAVNRRQANNIKGSRRREGGVFSSCAGAVPGYGALCIKGGADFVCFDRVKFLEGIWDNSGALPNADPCVAVGKILQLPRGEVQDVEASLSWGATMESALAMPQIAKEGDALVRVQIQTPDAALNHMINDFLPAQMLASRIQGRTGFYQCGGAWGFRDQLQDVSALLLQSPRLVRQHIVRCCAVQFPQGDVLHWWHRLPRAAGGLRGVRTRCSDDFLWLPLVCCEYVEKTGDSSILEIPVPYLSGDELGEHELERYFQPTQSSLRESVYDHCLRAVRNGMQYGEHGLPLIGVGDWNDGFSRVGAKGRGESVWLALFYSMVLEKMAALCARRQDTDNAQEFRALAEKMRTTVDAVAWDEDHYLRAFFDDGSPMGKSGNRECAIDSLPQSFSVLAGMPDDVRRRAAMDAAVRNLVDTQHGIVKLFTPPFSGQGARPGYVAAYPPGIRENGGQYTHAAMWLVIALLRMGDVQQGYQILRLLNPAAFCQDSARAQTYRAEPYAMAGDVSGAPGMEGRAGWTLYSGSAAWFYRAVLEELFGLQLKEGKLFLQPRLPESWERCHVQIHRPESKIIIALKNSAQDSLLVDDHPAEWITLDDQDHTVRLE